MGVYLCPECGSGKVVTKETLERSAAFCQECHWEGEAKDLVRLPSEAVVRHVGDGGLVGVDYETVIAMEVSKEYLQRLSQNAATPIGLAILDSGLISRSDTKTLTRLLRAACLGAHRATLEELEKIQQEHADAERTPS